MPPRARSGSIAPARRNSSAGSTKLSSAAAAAAAAPAPALVPRRAFPTATRRISSDDVEAEAGAGSLPRAAAAAAVAANTAAKKKLPSSLQSSGGGLSAFFLIVVVAALLLAMLAAVAKTERGELWIVVIWMRIRIFFIYFIEVTERRSTFSYCALTGWVPCGNGCMPGGSVCCDHDSSFFSTYYCEAGWTCVGDQKCHKWL